jgi:hypothetical protein
MVADQKNQEAQDRSSIVIHDVNTKIKEKFLGSRLIIKALLEYSCKFLKVGIIEKYY